MTSIELLPWVSLGMGILLNLIVVAFGYGKLISRVDGICKNLNDMSHKLEEQGQRIDRLLEERH